MKNRPSYQKDYRSKPELHICVCGKKAVKMNGGCPICQTCLDIGRTNIRRDYEGRREYKSRAKQSKAEIFWDGTLTGFKKQGVGWGSLEILEARLK